MIIIEYWSRIRETSCAYFTKIVDDFEIQCSENQFRASIGCHFHTTGRGRLLFYSRETDTREIYRQRRRERSEAMINNVNGDSEFCEKVVTSDDARVDFGDFVHKQSDRGVEIHL